MNNYSLREVFRISLPLIISAFGFHLMLTCDRLMLARYDLTTMNAVVAMGTLMFLFEYSLTSITVTSEIYAGQYNGAKQYHLVSIATWQMLFLAFFSILIYVPLGLFGGKYLINDAYFKEAGAFFKWLMCFSFIPPALGAINGFFIGIKKPKIITINTIVGNIINIALSYIFIFGIEGYIKPLGALGAAISTSIALVLQIGVIISFFTRKKYHYKFQTRDWRFNKEIFIGCLKLGVPSSIGLIIEMAGNYIVQIIMINMASEYVVNYNIALNIFIFTAFLLNGMHKGVSGLAANIIGARKLDQIPTLLQSALYLHFIFSSIICLVTLSFPEKLSSLYTSDPQIIKLCVQTLPFIGLHFLFDGTAWIISSVTMAGGDTKFAMYINSLVVWIFRVLPIYLCLKMGINFANMTWIIFAFSSFILSLIFCWRYGSGKWLKFQVS